MALIGTLAVNLTANTGRLSAGLNSSAKMVGSWSSRVGSSVDAAFSRLASGGIGAAGGAAKSLKGNLDKISSASKTARTALNFADVGRYMGKASTGVATVGLLFAGSGERAAAMRSKVNALSSGLTTLGTVSKQARKALFWTDVTVFFAKLATVAGGAFGSLASGFASMVAGGARATVGLVNFVAGTIHATASTVRFAGNLVSLGFNLAKMAAGAALSAVSLGRLGLASRLLKSGALNAFVAGFSALFNGQSIARGIGSLTNGFRNIAGGLIQATAGVLRFGLGLGKLGISVVTGALSGLKTMLTGVASAFMSVGAAALSFVGIGGLIAGALGIKAASAAAHLNETINTTKQVFGEAADGVVKSAEQMNAAYGTNRKVFLEGANALGSQFQAAGYAEKSAAALSDQILKLAADANASRDPVGGFAEALGKIRSGLSGEQEPLKAWGLDLSEQAVKLEAVSMGLAKQGAELTNAGKVQARLSLITKGLAKDQGALAREATGPAAQMSEFWGRAQTLMETVGASLAPTFGAALEVVNQVILTATDSWGSLSSGISGFLSGVGSTLVGWAGAVADFFELGTGKTDLWRVALGVLTNAWQMVGVAFHAVSTVVLSDLSYIFGGLSYLGSGFDFVFAKITGESAGVGDYLARLGDKMEATAVNQAGALSEAWSKPWASATDAPDKLAEALTAIPKKVTSAYEAAGQKMKAMRADLAKPIAAEIAPPAGAAVVDKKAKKIAKHDPFAGAMTLGSTEAASTVLRSRYGSPGKDGTAANTKRSAELLARIDANQREQVRILRDRQDFAALDL